MYSRVPGATRTHTAARCLCASLALLFLPKSTPGGGVAMCDPLRWRARCWGFLLTHRCDRGFTLSISSPTTRVFSCLSHLLPPLLHKERPRMLEKCSLFWPPDMQAQPDSKANYRALGKIWQLFVLCGCCCFAVRYFFLSLISHAWRCLKVELQHHGGKMWRLFSVVVVVSVDIFC